MYLRHICVQLDLVDNLVFLAYILEIVNYLCSARVCGRPFMIRRKGEAIEYGWTVPALAMIVPGRGRQTHHKRLQDIC